MTDELDRDRMAAQAQLAAAALAQGEDFDHWSLALTVLGLAALGLAEPGPGRWLFIAPLLSGLIERYYCARVGIDRAIFAAWAERWPRQGSDPLDDLQRLDEGRVALRLGARSTGCAKPLGSLADRAESALRLLRRQILAFVVQMASLLLALATARF